MLMLFTDGSVHSQFRIGYGAYLACEDLNEDLDVLRSAIKIRRFENTSSSRLELQTILWAMSELKTGAIEIFTDSESVLGLQSRRLKLEKNDYVSSSGKLLKNHDLYREYFMLSDILSLELIQVKGHKPSSRKNSVDSVFSLVDRAARKALRIEMSRDGPTKFLNNRV